MANIPLTRAELLRNIQERVEIAKEAGCDLVMLETWEAAWLVVPALMAVEADADGTGEIAFNFENADVTRPHEVNAVRIASAADYIRGLDCEGATEEYQT